jgi:hypothetical protein
VTFLNQNNDYYTQLNDDESGRWWSFLVAVDDDSTPNTLDR